MEVDSCPIEDYFHVQTGGFSTSMFSESECILHIYILKIYSRSLYAVKGP